ncbi:MAG: class I SAM-dependent methyltransferase [Bacteroidota bacterium]
MKTTKEQALKDNKRDIEDMMLKHKQHEIIEHPWNSEPEVGDLIKALINIQSGRNVLEIGVFKGASYLTFADSCIEYTGIDIEDHREQVVKDKMELNAHKFILGDSLVVLKELKEDNEKFDLIFVDSIHTFEHCMAEFKICEGLIKNKGLIVFHDAVKFSGVAGVMDYIKSFPHFDVITLDTPDHPGRGGASGIAVVRCNYQK